MLEKLKEGLLFEPLTEEEKQRRGILGRLYGPIASFKVGTRNGRFYNEDLWEKVFENDIVKELLAQGGIPGELDHPTTREETDSTKIAVMMPEAPKKDKQGHLVGYFDIIDTPCGKIAAALAKYGFRFGVSSRGTGDVVTDENGNESVDPNTYALNAWDLVLIPACEDARMTFQESYNPNTSKLKTELFNDINNASESDREIMMETLDNLDVDYTPAWVAGKKGKSVLAENTGNSQTQRLQSLLKENRELKQQVKELNAKLSVGYAQGNEMQTSLNEALSQAKASEDKVGSLNEENKALKEDFKQLKEVQRRLAEQNRDAIADKKKLSDLSTKLNESLEVNKKLNGDINSIRENLEVAQRTIKTQKQTFVEQLNQKDARIATLEENIKNDGAIYKEGIVKAKNLVEKYKKMSASAVNGYIRLKANMIGVPESQIKSRLGESYTFSDIDKICESLMPTIKQRNSLPFNSKVIGAKVTSQKIEDVTPQKQADVVDIFGYSEW